ncbi:hypothetical protein QFC19_008279 [Naganishia cerealis]|uniref:Uncharacterized protein n=1 Tax=Naganishia cerealis TaxID=610337 RepID=A0ACC2V3L4_9TREE|nr:hypothetical protein QFC19_008279 [Naganishia cerealis]
MSAPTPGRGTPSSRGNRGGKASSYARTKANNLKYGTPLPIVLPASPLHPAYVEPPVPEFVLARRRAQAKERGEPLQEEKSAVIPSPIAFMVQLLSKLSAPTTTKEPVVPVCRGTYDPLTRSVFVTTTDDRNILFDRGFFGKGNLSRSEASWKTRRVKLLQEIAGLAAAGGKRDGKKTAEEVTAERRRERKQFKIDRAQAILNASLAAEAILRSSIQQQGDGATEAFDESASLHRVESTRSNNTSADVAQGVNGTQPDILVPGVQDYAHVLPEGVTRLTPQTFLQRPTRPDSKPKGRKPQSHPPTPPPPPTVATSDVPQNPTTLPESQAVTAISREEEQSASPMVPSGEDLVDPESVEDLEHLQLNLEEAFFLSWALGCLEVVDPKTAGLSPCMTSLYCTSNISSIIFGPSRAE